jgi:hypothetical protein
MAYFPNGTSHQCYLETLCTRCRNFRDLQDGRGPGCPILDLHFQWNYEAVNDQTKRQALNHFIPIEEDEFGHKTINADCLMFLPADVGRESPDTGPIPDDHGDPE